MPALDSFRAVRWIRTLNLVLQALLFLTFFAGLNHVARNHPWRFDLTRQRRFSLAPETLSYVRNLPRPVEIVVTSAEPGENTEVRGLLEAYVHATGSSGGGRITVRYLDVYQDRRKAEELGLEQPNAVLLRSGDKRRALLIDELYRMKDKERAAFLGEQVLTDAILDVSNSEKKRIYFLVGHGELQPGDTDPARGLSYLRDQLRVRNFLVDTLELAVNRRVPEDAALLVAVQPQVGYTRAEQEMLRQFLGVNAGRLILLLAPGGPVARLGLDDLLLDWGVLVDDDVVIDPSPQNVAEDLDLIIRAFDAKHPIARGLWDRGLTLRFGPTRTVRADPGRSTAGGLIVAPVAATSAQAWGEVAYTRAPAVRDANDIRPMKGVPPEDALSVVTASERVPVRDNLPFSVRGGRLVVFGTGDAVSNRRLGFAGNFDAFLGAVNWTVDRDHQLNVPARPVERFQLALSAAEFMRLRYTLLLGLPGAALLLGLAVHWTRRR